MREICFRGFHPSENGTQEIWTSGTCQGEKVKGKIKGEWLEGCYVYDNNLNHHIRAFDNCYYAVIPETVGQFTGLTDKNGKKIFEGDMVKDNYGNKGLVFYSEHFSRWQIRFTSGRDDLVKYGDIGVHIFDWIYPKIELEVIGTIFDKEGV